MRTWLKWVSLPQGLWQGKQPMCWLGLQSQLKDEQRRSFTPMWLLAGVQLFLVGTELLDWGSKFLTEYWLETSLSSLPHRSIQSAVPNMAACFDQASKSVPKMKTTIFLNPGVSSDILITSATFYSLATSHYIQPKLKRRGLHNGRVPRRQTPLKAILEAACHKEEVNIMSTNRLTFAYVVGRNIH